jgi:hypothetical protein
MAMSLGTGVCRVSLLNLLMSSRSSLSRLRLLLMATAEREKNVVKIETG